MERREVRIEILPHHCGQVGDGRGGSHCREIQGTGDGRVQVSKDHLGFSVEDLAMDFLPDWVELNGMGRDTHLRL